MPISFRGIYPRDLLTTGLRNVTLRFASETATQHFQLKIYFVLFYLLQPPDKANVLQCGIVIKYKMATFYNHVLKINMSSTIINK